MIIGNEFIGALLSISFQAGVLVLLVLCIKALFGRFLTPGWQFGLWLLVILRLIVPVGPESGFSLSNYLSPSNFLERKVGGDKAFHGFLTLNPASSITAEITESGTTDNLGHLGGMSAHGSFLLSPSGMLLIIWAIGAGWMLLMFARNARRLSQIIRRAVPIDEPAIDNLFHGCLLTAGIKRRVKLRLSDEISTPALAGLFRPVVLLPSEATSSYSAAELRAIVLHELVHLRRGDIPVGCVAALLQAVHWFNPLIWIAFHRMRADRELACDAEVVRLLGQGGAAEYGRTILKLAEHATAPHGFAASIGIIEVKSETGKRIVMISRTGDRSKWSSAFGFAVAVILVAVSFTEARSQEPTPATSYQSFSAPPEAEAPSQKPVPLASFQSLITPLHLEVPPPVDATFGTMFPFTLKVDENVGELIYKFDDSKQLETIKAKTGVVFSTKGTTITCEELHYDTKTHELTATGARVSTELKAESGYDLVTSDKLTYKTADVTMIFEGDVVVRHKDENGWILKTLVTEKMTIGRKDGHGAWK